MTYSTEPRRRAAQALLVGLALAASAVPALAHQFRSAYVQLAELGDREYALQVRMPRLPEDRITPIRLDLPGCTSDAPAEIVHSESYLSRSSRWRCDQTLSGAALQIDGIGVLTPDVMVELDFSGGGRRIFTLDGDQPGFVFEPAPQRRAVEWRGYLALGVEHILSGIDHLLFVTGLLLIVWRGAEARALRLLRTITAFTLAHSITLGASALGLVRLPSAPVEACIAASILLLAVELARRSPRPSLTFRKPWLPAFAFGLLHGFGFAGALADIGLPQDAKLPALAMFNVGVELGQLAFVAALMVLARAAGLLRWPLLQRMPALTTQFIGIVAAYWAIERSAAVFA
jgi:hypothetical protein